MNSVSAPVRATAISINLFCIHFFGDTFSPQIIGAISDHSNLSIGLGATLIFLVISAVILRVGVRYAPPLEELPSLRLMRQSSNRGQTSLVDSAILAA